MIRILCIIYLQLFFLQNLSAQGPGIINISPNSGKVGIVDSIYGTNFSAVDTLNQVIFGNRKAKILYSSTTLLVVQVPEGCGLVEVSVSVGNHSAMSMKKFRYTFDGGLLDGLTFGLTYSYGLLFEKERCKVVPEGLVTTALDLNSLDLDGDGINEDVQIHPDRILIYKNISNVNNNSVIPVSILSENVSVSSYKYTDINNDGRIDIILASNVQGQLNIFFNNSSIGNLSFTQSTILLKKNIYIEKFDVVDLNADGKKDIVFVAQRIIYTAKNTSATINQLAFAECNQISTKQYNSFKIGDLNNDLKPEIILSTFSAPYEIQIFHNKCTIDSMDGSKFSVQSYYSSPNLIFTYDLADLDFNSWTDIVVKGNVLLRNQSSGSTISFSTIQTGLPANDEFLLGDIDGDGGVDLVHGVHTQGTFTVFRNNIQASGFASAFTASSSFVYYYDKIHLLNRTAIRDMDGDNRADFVGYNYNGGGVYWFRNYASTLDIEDFTVRRFGRYSNLRIKCNVNILLGNGNKFIVQLSDPSGSFANPVNIGVSSNSGPVIHINASIPGNAQYAENYKIRVITTNPYHVSTNTVESIAVVPRPLIAAISPLRAKAGEVIRITGTGFESDVESNLVYFGAINGKVIKATGTYIDVVVPFGASADNIEVITNGMTSRSALSFNYKYNSNLTNLNGNFFSRFKYRLLPYFHDFNFTNSDYRTAYPELGVLTGSTSGAMYSGTLTPISDTLMAENFTEINTYYYKFKQIEVADVNFDAKKDLICSVLNENKIAIQVNSTQPFLMLNTLGPATHFVVKDINRDGGSDIIVLHKSLNQFAIYKNRSFRGSMDSLWFDSAIGFSTGISNGCIKILVEDVDQDGKNDILVLDSLGSTFHIFKNIAPNDSTILFSSPVSFTTVTRPTDMALGDLNLDGKLDLVICNKTNILKVYINTGNGWYIDPSIFNTNFQLITSGMVMRALTIVDMNNDGKDDILSNGNCLINGYITGQINQNHFTSFYTHSMGLNKVRLCDLNIDGLMDLVELTPGKDTAYVSFNRSPRLIISRYPKQVCIGDTFEIAFSTGVIGGDAFTLQVSDKNGSFVNPKWTYSGNSTTAYDTLSIPTSAFSESELYRIRISSSIGTEDVLDIAFRKCARFTGYAKDNVFVGDTLKITGTNFTKVDKLSFGNTAIHKFISKSDTDLYFKIPIGLGYGPTKLLMTGESAVQKNTAICTKYRRDTLYTPYLASLYNPSVGNSGLVSIESIYTTYDLNNDGRMEIISRSSYGQTAFRVCTVEPDNRIKTLFTDGSGAQIMDFDIADIDNNGFVDFIIGHYDGRISVYLNQSTAGKIVFAKPIFILVNKDIARIDIGDLDNDGKEDVVAYGSTSGIISVLKNVSGRSEFNQESLQMMFNLSQPNPPYRTFLVDLDGDGYRDIVFLYKLYGEKIAIYRNAGRRNLLRKQGFYLASTIICLPNTIVLEIEDLNNDNKPDLIGVQNNSNTISLYHNVSVSGQLDSTSFLCYNKAANIFIGSVNHIETADIDADGWKDICVNGTSNGIGMFRNTHKIVGGSFNDSSFGPVSTIPHNAGAFDFVDFNNDGMMDLLYNPSYQGYLEMRYNQSPRLRITTTQWTTEQFYPNDSIRIAYKAPIGLFSPGNTFSLHLTEVAALDSTPKSWIIGSKLSAVSDIIDGILPENIDPQKKYKLTISGNMPNVNSMNELVIKAKIPPVVAYFTPLMAEPGQIVTICGKNFSAFRDSILVYFGTIRAVILENTTNQIRVIVPFDVMPGRISVSVEGITSISQALFIPTFRGLGILDSNSIDIPKKLVKGNFRSLGKLHWLADMDGDGKLEYVSHTGIYHFNNALFKDSIVVDREIKTNLFDAISWSPPSDFIIKDANLDGQMEFIEGRGGCNANIFLDKNIQLDTVENLIKSTYGAFTPSSPYQGVCSTSYNTPICEDFNGDGINEFAIESSYGFELSVFNKAIKFPTNDYLPEYKVNTFGGVVVSGERISSDFCADLDGDSLPEFIGSKGIFLNTSLGGITGNIGFIKTFHFPSKTEFKVLTYIDEDTKLDIVYTYQDTIYFLRNNSVKGSINFTLEKKIFIKQVKYLATSDYDGDGKADIIVLSEIGGENPKVCVFRNNSTNSIVAFDLSSSKALPIGFVGSSWNNFLYVTDITGDKRPDIVISNAESDSCIYYFKNLCPLFAANVSSKKYCKGDSIIVNVLINEVIFGQGNVFSLELSDSNGNFINPVILRSNITDVSQTIYAKLLDNLSDSYRYRVRVVSSFPTIKSRTNLDSFSIQSIPQTQILTGINAKLCDGDSIRLFIHPNQEASYKWFYNGASMANETDSSIIIKSPGTYSLTVNRNGCEKIAHDTFIPAHALPDIQIHSTNGLAACSGDSVLLTAIGVGTLKYHWYFNETASMPDTLKLKRASNSGKYSVMVTDSNDCSKKSQDVIVDIRSLPVSVLTVERPLIFCDQDSTIIKGNPGIGLRYRWLRNDTLLLSDSAQRIIVKQSGLYKLLLTDTFGCSGFSRDTLVKVNSNPDIDITASGGMHFCSGDSVVLTAISSRPLKSYIWMQNGLLLPNDTLSYLTVKSTGLFRLKVIDSVSCKSINLDTFVAVNPKPLAVLSVSRPTKFCAGDSTELGANQGIGYKYEWRRDGALIDTSQNLVVHTKGNYSLIVKDSNNCISFSRDTSIVVTALPQAEITSNLPMSFCEMDSVVLRATVITGYTFAWRINGIFPQQDTLSDLVVKNSCNVALKVIDANNCKAISKDTSIEAYPLPQANITSTKPLHLCKGDSLTLSSANIAGYHYKWIRNGTYLQQDTFYELNVTDTGNYALRVIDHHQCSSLSRDTFVEFAESPEAIISSVGSLSFCENDSVQLKVSTAPDYTHQWMLDTMILANATQSSLVVKKGGRYSVKNMNGKGCKLLSDEILIKVFDRPLLPVISRDDMELSSSFSYGNQWYVDGSIISGAVNQRLIPTKNGLYQVLVTDSNSCRSDSSLAFNWSFTGLNKLMESSSLILYPNPTTGVLYLSSKYILLAKLYNSEGKLVHEFELKSGEEKKVDISNYKPGIYVLSVLGNNVNEVFKVFKK